MTLIYISLSAFAIFLIINIFLTFKSGKRQNSHELSEIRSSIGTLTQGLLNTERNLKEEFVTDRKENADSLKNVREEIGNQLNIFTKTFSDNLSALIKSNEDRLE